MSEQQLPNISFLLSDEKFNQICTMDKFKKKQLKDHEPKIMSLIKFLNNLMLINPIIFLGRPYNFNKKYDCSICHKLFADKSNLNRHINDKHKKNSIYQCPFCGFFTRQPSNTASHAKRTHRVPINYKRNISYEANHDGNVFTVKIPKVVDPKDFLPMDRLLALFLNQKQ